MYLCVPFAYPVRKHQQVPSTRKIHPHNAEDGLILVKVCPDARPNPTQDGLQRCTDLGIVEGPQTVTFHQAMLVGEFAWEILVRIGLLMVTDNGGRGVATFCEWDYFCSQSRVILQTHPPRKPSKCSISRLASKFIERHSLSSVTGPPPYQRVPRDATNPIQRPTQTSGLFFFLSKTC